MQIVLHKYTKTSMTSKASFLFLIVFIAAIISSFSYSYCRRKDLYIRRCVSNLRVLASKPVDITFEPSGKKIIAEQGELIEQVARKAGVTIPFKCKQGRCNSCEIRMNGKGLLYKYKYSNDFQ